VRLHRNAERVQEALTAAGSAARVVEFEESTRTAAEAAAVLGIEVGQIAKSIVFAAGGEPVLVIAAGDHRVDVAKAAQVAGVERLDRADADLVREATGYPIGGVPPIGHPRELRIVIDESLGRFEQVWAAAGTPRAVFPTSLSELQRMTGGVLGDVSPP
jgi:prolyl-tRNA editing enzyme YbaK/EbsC (Cys-tRNA(Pro) deacylase)